MHKFVDIHTHNTKVNDIHDIIKIININLDERMCINKVSDIYNSIGIHPWDLDKNQDFAEKLLLLNQNIDNECVIALGEAGLDKIHKDTFKEQEKLFAEQVKIAEQHQKPMIIHNVKSGSELIALHKRMNVKMMWIIHGFQGSSQEAKQMISHGFYLSLGEVLYRNENQAETLLKTIPLNHLFLETDVSGRDIRDVYFRAAAMMSLTIEDLRNGIFTNFAHIFKK